MSVYRKDSSGKLVKIAGSLTQRWNMLILPTRHSKLSVTNDEGESFDYDCYEITEAAEPYITKLTEMTTYSLFLEDANETTTVIVKYKNQSLLVYGNTIISIGQLQGKIDLYTTDFGDFNAGNLVINGLMALSVDNAVLHDSPNPVMNSVLYDELEKMTDLQNQLNDKLSTTGGNLTGAIAIKSTDGTLVSHLNDDGTNDYGVSYKNNTFEFGNFGKGIKLLGNTARPKYESTTTEDDGVELALLSDVETRPVDETYSISEAQWQALADNEPYTYVASVTATHTIGTNTEVGTLNNSPALFATYGFVVGTVNNQTVQIFSIDKPTTNVSLTVRYRG